MPMSVAKTAVPFLGRLGLDPSVKVPSSLLTYWWNNSDEDWNEEDSVWAGVRACAPQVQQTILNAYAHTLHSIAGSSSKAASSSSSALTVKRRRELLERCIRKHKHQDDKNKNNTPSTPTTTSTASTTSDSHNSSSSSTPITTTASTASASVTLPRTKFQLEQEAAVLFHSLPQDLQPQALAACDEAALRVIQKGTSIRKPIPFFTNVLHKLIPKDLKNKTKVENKTKLKANKTEDKPSIQILQKNHATKPTKQPTQPKPSSTSTKNPTTVAAPAAAEIHRQHAAALETVVADLRNQLEMKQDQLCQEQHQNEQLHKLLENEQHTVTVAQTKIQELNKTVQQLQQQLIEKDDYIQTLQQQQTQEQQQAKDIMIAFSKLSQELCHTQQEKRHLEQTLQQQMEEQQVKDREIQQLKAALKRSELLRPTPRNNTQQLERIQTLEQELQQTQQQLHKVIMTSSSSNKTRQKQQNNHNNNKQKKPSLAEFVVNNSTPSPFLGNVQILQRSSSNNDSYYSDSNPPLSLLPPPPPSTSFACQQQVHEPETNSGIQFHGIDKGYDHDHDDDNDDDDGQVENTNQNGSELESNEDDNNNSEYDITTEIDFLMASFAPDEISVETNTATNTVRVTRMLHLECDRNAEVVVVHLILTLPEGYPHTTPLQVEASLAPPDETISNNNKKKPPGTPSVETQKVAMDSLPSLIDVCRWEANGSIGTNALFSVLQTADEWVRKEWNGIQAKRLPTLDASGNACLPSSSPKGDASNGGGSFCLSRTLIGTHHLVDPDKITVIKNNASHYHLGGYIQLGYPGYLLVEGLEDNCSFFLELLMQQRVKFRSGKFNKKCGGKPDSSSFTVVGKISIQVEDIDVGRQLPRKLIEIEKSKEGFECLQGFCEQVGLAKYIK